MATEDPRNECALHALRLVPRINRWVAARVLQGHLAGDLSLRQLTALYVIREESATLGYLARRLMVTPAVATGIVDRLEKRGYVRRGGEPGDRRRVRLFATESGRSRSLEVEGTLVAEIATAMAAFDRDEVDDVRRGLALLERVLGELEAPTDLRPGKGVCADHPDDGSSGY